MKEDTIIELGNQAGEPIDHLTEILRQGARQLITNAVETELAEFIEQFNDRKTEEGKRLIVRNGYLPAREILTGIGPIKVQVPKVRDRSGSGIKFNSQLLPPYMRRTPSVEEVLPCLYLKGVSTGDFQEALCSLLGKDAKGLSASVISRLKRKWEQEHDDWSCRDLSDKRYVYFWVDGVYFNVRMDAARQCILIIIGVTESGKKELVAVEEGYRESEQSWFEILMDLKHRGLQYGPKLALGDGSLGFWNALSKVYPETRHQRCWVHKTANVLNKVPKSVQGKMKQALHEIWMAETREDAHKAFNKFVAIYGAKYPNAVDCLEKDREDMLAFYDFPAEHWQHIRTTNPIESTFATVRLRTNKTRGCVSRATILSMVFKLGRSAEKRWRRLRGFRLLGEVVRGVCFINGLRKESDTEQNGKVDPSRIAA